MKMPQASEPELAHQHLVRLLEYHDLTNGDLADMCDVDRTTITRWTAGTVGVPAIVIRYLELTRELKLLNGRCRVYWHAPIELEDQA